MKGTIVTLGGGGFSVSEDGSSAIDDYLLEVTGKARPRVCFVPTAGGDADGYSQRFEAAFAGRADTAVLAQAAANGTVLAGISAGMNWWFEASSTDSFGPLAPLADGLGFLPGERLPALSRRTRPSRGLPAVGGDGYAAAEYAAIVWRDGACSEAVAERKERPVFRVGRTADGAVEHELPVRLLVSAHG